MMKTVVAIGQMTSGQDKSHNLDFCEDIIRRAKSYGAKVVALPENFLYLGAGDKDAAEQAESLNGPSISRLKKMAKESGLWLFLGGFQERIDGANSIHNSHVVINNSGEISCTYQKMHLFSVNIPGEKIYDEARYVAAGNRPCVVDTPFFRAGLSICYDLRFANLYRRLRLMGANVLLVPAAFTVTTGKAHWEVLLRARAIETQSYVLAAAQIGRHSETRASHGHAMIIDPWGTPLAQCGANDSIAVAEIDLDYVANVREHLPIDKHWRFDLDDKQEL